jgi:hypothetical protein
MKYFIMLNVIKRFIRARHQWLTPVILATQEAEISRTTVQSQSGQIVHETVLKGHQKKKGWWSGSRCRYIYGNIYVYIEIRHACMLFVYMCMDIYVCRHENFHMDG